MMKIYTFLIACLMQTFILPAKGIDFRLYNQSINEAESAIMSQQYNTAIEHYQSAFSIKDKPFAKDLYNASLCAIKTDDLSLALKCCKRLAQKGVGSNFFKLVPSYSKLYTDKEWKTILQDADQSRAAFQIANAGLLNTIDSLVQKDQKLNKEWRESGMAVEQEDRMYATNDTIARHLKYIFDSLGFLSEEMIGATLDKNGLLSYSLPFDVILVHNYQSRMQGDTLFNTTLRKALLHGEISPDYYSTILDMGTNSGTRPYYGAVRLYSQYKCKVLLDGYNHKRLREIDRNRAMIGLCSTSEYLKRVVFRIQHPSTEFKITVQLTVLTSYADAETEQAALKSSIVVLDNIPDCKS